MVEAGIECRTIFPLRFPWILSNWNYRDHCKIVTVDGKKAFTGGMNVGYEYTGLNPDVGFWRDTHLQITGEASVDLQTVFDVHWNIAVPEQVKSKINLKTKSEVTKINPIGRVDLSRWSAELGSELSTIDGKEMDGELIEAGVQIYQYNKGMLHAKLMIIDEEIAEVGAANYDMRSFRLNYEVCQVVYSADVARELTEQFERDLTDSVPLRMEDLLQRSLTERIVEQGARLLSPLL